jgi:hypothetical protein
MSVHRYIHRELHCHAFHFVVAVTFRHACEELAVELEIVLAVKSSGCSRYISTRSAHASLSWILLSTAVYPSPCCSFMRAGRAAAPKYVSICGCLTTLLMNGQFRRTSRKKTIRGIEPSKICIHIVTREYATPFSF